MSITPPTIHAVRSLLLPAYQTTILANGMALYALQGGFEPVMKIEIVFRAGASYENKTGIAECMAGLLSEGTEEIGSAELAEQIETYGATLQTRGGVDTIRIRLYTLTRYFQPLIQLVRQIIQQPSFDPKELDLHINNKIERLQIDLKKNEVLAYRHLTEAIYGPVHPYGRNAFPQDFQRITAEDLRSHHQRHVIPSKGMIFLSGSYGPEEVRLIHRELGEWRPASTNGKEDRQKFETVTRSGLQEFEGPQGHQAAVRIGRRLFTQDHPDFNGVFVLNTILGGYFGSRLMNEVRENQGLTYGIYSGVDTFAEDGCFYISTETATTNTEKVIEAIHLEARRLQTELILEGELQMARNYLMGHLMTQIDGPFSTMDHIKTLKIEYQSDDTFASLVETIQQITPGQLRDLAVRYLNLEDWVTIVVK